MPDFDVLAIGGGTAGLTIAIGGNLFGMKTALVERHRVGGECTWTGCVPSKAILHVADVAAAARKAAEWSVDGAPAPRIDFAKVRAHVHGARNDIWQHESPDALRRQGVTVLEGTARLKGPAGEKTVAVEVDGRTVTARHVVVCTGSDPAVPNVPGLADVRYFTNETVFDELETLPGRLAVIGGGPIGCELAQAFARLGSAVTLLQSQDRLLPREDASVAPVLRKALERDGVTVVTGATLTRAEAGPDGARGATLSYRLGRDTSAGPEQSVAVDAVLVAAGRRARVKGFGLEEAGVALERDGITVDEHLQTSVPGVWATGDCVGPYRFTHVAEMMGRVVLRNIMFPWKKQKVDYSVIPWATFTDPEIGRVGLTEAEARERHGSRVEVTVMPMSRNDRAVTEGATDGFIKLVTHRKHIAGAHIVGPAAGELTQQVAMAMKWHLPVFALGMVTVYPAVAYGLHQAGDRAAMQHLKRGGFGPRMLGLVRRLALR
jgi:pyruvate/2-oxoglutarate dehydrogenase complex dihydrolipoamide dehydrogenase (E3) component